MTESYALANQKGGVGKTTTAINLAASLAIASQRVLLIDLDPQGNATSGSGIDKSAIKHSVADVLLNKTSIETCVVRSKLGNYDIVPTNDGLATIEFDLISQPEYEYCMRNALKEIGDKYHYILIDCPPTLGILTLNGLNAVQHVLVPLQCEYYALEGLSSLRKTIARVRESTNPDLNIEGILRTMYDARNNLARDVSEELTRHFKSTVYQTIIPRNVTLAEAPSHGQSAIYYDKHSAGARAYLMLAGEVIRRDIKRKKINQAYGEKT